MWTAVGLITRLKRFVLCPRESAVSRMFERSLGELGPRNWQDIQGETSEDFLGQPADVTRMKEQLFNVLAQKTRGIPFQTVKNMSEEERCCSAGAWVKLLRAYNGKNQSRSQRLTERVHDIKRVSSQSQVLARMETWEPALKEHVMDNGCVVADITIANSVRLLCQSSAKHESCRGQTGSKFLAQTWKGAEVNMPQVLKEIQLKANRRLRVGAPRWQRSAPRDARTLNSHIPCTSSFWKMDRETRWWTVLMKGGYVFRALWTLERWERSTSDWIPWLTSRQTSSVFTEQSQVYVTNLEYRLVLTTLISLRINQSRWWHPQTCTTCTSLQPTTPNGETRFTITNKECKIYLMKHNWSN